MFRNFANRTVTFSFGHKGAEGAAYKYRGLPEKIYSDLYSYSHIYTRV